MINSHEKNEVPKIIYIKENNGCLVVIAIILLLILISPFLIPLLIAGLAFLVAVFAAIL